MHSNIDVRTALRTGHRTIPQLLEEYLTRIAQREDAVRAWVCVDVATAQAHAVRLQAELASGHDRGPLHGIPVGIKDIFDVYDLPTAAGSRLWAKSIARQDSTVVARLRAAGAIILGKTVTTAYASFDPPPTRNPWHAARTPGGSSSGSAAAVAAGMCFGAIASQTGGSVTRPAAYCGVCSLKPTYGHISLAGALPLAPSLDHVGMMTQRVGDLAAFYAVLRDPAHGPWAAIAPQRCELYVPSGLFHERADPDTRSAFAALCDRLRTSWTLSPTTLPASFAVVPEKQRQLMAVEAAAYHEVRLRQHPDDYPPCITQLLEEGLALTGPEVVRLKEHHRATKHELREWFGSNTILLTPAATSAAPLATTTGDPSFNSPWSYFGLPTVSLPYAWTADGLPLSVQLIAPPDREAMLLAVAQQLEAEIQWEPRVEPGHH